MTIHNLKSYLFQTVNAAPLAVFRVCFGFMMLYGIIRFWLKGWIHTLYIEPSFHFTYYGFGWVDDWGELTYLLFVICGLSALLVMLGLFYRTAIVLFFLSFSYIELIDKTTYLNHYYFISVLSFLLCFVPANATFSLDNLRKKNVSQKVQRFYITSIQALIMIVYLYAGLAKVNSDWLLKAQPLSIWLFSKYDLPLFGNYLFQQTWMHYLMSWGGMLYDLTIPFLLITKRFRWFAFSLVLFFHLFTAILFPIGMFPYIMILSALIFFSEDFHKKCIDRFHRTLNVIYPKKSPNTINAIQKEKHQRLVRPISIVLSLVIVFQILFPFRHLLYPGELFWHEQGYRFSWRVMLMEKRGYTQFRIVDSVTQEQFYVKNEEFLTEFQEKQMSFQPDFILEFAHHLGKHYGDRGHQNVQVFANSYVALNGRKSQQFIDPEINLLEHQKGFGNKTWILPFNDEIKGF
ncbi:MAG: HTTM domain-containing protein [Bacteroidota bacterium]|nr:HTTM domain-containing protein [Bacteroidota bacterium]